MWHLSLQLCRPIDRIVSMSFSATHPQFSDRLVHLSGRARSRAPGTPEERLASIVQDHHIAASDTFSRCSRRYVSFTEVTFESLNHVFSRASYAPWGIVFRKDLVFERGGAPVLYVRTDEWAGTATWAESAQARVVRFDLTGADWMWEREWRVPGAEGFRFDDSDIVAVIAPADASAAVSTSGNAARIGATRTWLADLDAADKLWTWSRDDVNVRRAS